MLKLVRFFLVILVVAGWGTASAQQRRIKNKPFIDERRFHYGFFLGVHDQGLKLRDNGYINPETGEQWLAENDTQNFGFSVGILGEWRLTKNLGLRVTPSMHFGSKHIKFRNLQTQTTESQDLKSCFIGVPVALKIAAPRFNNYRPYVVCGAQPMFDLTSKKHARLSTKPFDTMLEVGIGCDFYLPFFKLIPELKFSFGLADVLDRKRNDLTDASQMVFTQSVANAHNNQVSLTFYFE